jgi:hypothetical protein
MEGWLLRVILNAVEHDKFNPPEDAVIEQLTGILCIPADILYHHANRLSPDLRGETDRGVLEGAYRAFREALNKKSEHRAGNGSMPGGAKKFHSEFGKETASARRGPRERETMMEGEGEGAPRNQPRSRSGRCGSKFARWAPSASASGATPTRSFSEKGRGHHRSRSEQA